MNKQNENFPGRTFYQAGGVDWGRFLFWLIPAFAVAALLAAGMFQLFRIGHYYMIIVPLFAGLAVAGMIHLAITLGHCRSALAGGAAGAVAGLILYLGYFYSGMVHHLGSEAAKHPEWLPTYIRLRMETDVLRDTHRSRRDEERRRNHKGDVVFNWVFFTAEIVLVLSLTTLTGVKRSKKAYCAQCRKWMIREVTPFDPAQAAELMEALRTGSTRSLAALCAKSPFATVPNTTFAVEFCASLKEGRSRDCPVYGSVKDINVNRPGVSLDAFEHAKGKVLVRGMHMNPDELAALALRFPLFEAHAGRSAVAALAPKEEHIEAAEATGGALAEITPLGPEHAGKIMTRKTTIIGNAFALGGLVGMLAGFGLLAWGGLTAFPDKEDAPPGGVSPEVKARGIALMIIGGALGGGVLVCLCFDTSLFGNRYLRNRLRQELARRTSLAVDPNDPEALFVEVVPKLNWGKMMLDDASDIGLLLVDKSRREVRFEGDKERWRLPAAAITDSGIEVFAQGHVRCYFVVLRADHRNGFWEAPVRERRGLALAGWKQKKAARGLFGKIQEIRGLNPSGTRASV